MTSAIRPRVDEILDALTHEIDTALTDKTTKGGMRVPYLGDFAGCSIQSLKNLKRWVGRLNEGFDELSRRGGGAPDSVRPDRAVGGATPPVAAIRPRVDATTGIPWCDIERCPANDSKECTQSPRGVGIVCASAVSDLVAEVAAWRVYDLACGDSSITNMEPQQRAAYAATERTDAWRKVLELIDELSRPKT